MSAEHSIAEVKPEVSFLHELIRDVSDGKVRIPRFQRPYVWRRDQMLDLLDTIRLQYPIGSLLFWETDQSLSSTDWVGPIHIPQQKAGTTAYVLDGQQRLSTFVGVLLKPSVAPQMSKLADSDCWCIWFNVKSLQFEHHKPDDVLEAWHCPLWSLMNTLPFLQECQRVLATGDVKASDYINAMQELSRAFTTYKIPVIRLRNANLSQAVDIFSRLNSKGRSISPDQMVSALSYAEVNGAPSFNLAAKIDGIIEELDTFGFGSVARAIVLRTFMAAMEVDIYSTDWGRLIQKDGVENSKLQDVIDISSRAMHGAVGLLREIGVKTTRLLPYAMQLVALAAFFVKCNNPTKEQKDFLRRWFWVSSFTCHFAHGNPSQDNLLVKEFRDEISSNLFPTTLNTMRMDTAAEAFPIGFDMRSARARTFLLVLLSLKPMDKDGAEVVNPWKLIEDNGPNSVGRIFATVTDKELVSTPANRILQLGEEKRSQARNWLLELKSDPDQEKVGRVLESHAISRIAFDLLCQAKVDQFLHTRMDGLIEIERAFMHREGVEPPLELEAKAAPIDTE
jgi:hypothetical protein